MKNNTPNAARNELLALKTVKALNQKGFSAFYAETREEAVSVAMSLVGNGDVISFGGSITTDSLGVIRKLEDAGHSVIDRTKAKCREEYIEIMRQALLCDTFITGCNAISADGTLVNIDGTGNRVAAMTFGPKSVIILAGVNKITADLDSAHHRARNVAAPTNAQRFDINTPCKKDGLCHSCSCPDSICTYIVETRASKPAGRIKVIIIGEEIGM